jgi:hypothetical protein
MKIKTSELTGAALDWAVAKCEGVKGAHIYKGLQWPVPPHPDYVAVGLDMCGNQDVLAYSTDWSQGGPIIERESIDVLRDPNGTAGWGARVYISRRDVWCYGPTPLIAAMRCYCCSKLGDEIDIPEELCQQQNS